MHLYNVPIIQQDLRHEETIIQAINSLEYLQNVIKTVFDRIDERIQLNNTKITNINNRIKNANKQVENLVGINKAINIFSPNKYPSTDKFYDIPTTFSIDNHQDITLNKNYEVTSSLDPVNHRNIQEKLQFYHVKSKNEQKLKMNKIILMPEGLGKPPTNIKSINSLLLFNTNQNPYENYKNINTLKEDLKGVSTQENLSSGGKMEAAPLSISNRKVMNKQIIDNLMYTPGMDTAPELDVPIDLPDLPGIADDIMFNLNENEAAIGPSSSRSQIISSLISLPNLPEPEQMTDSKTNTITNVPPPPPPPSIIETKSNVTNTTEEAENNTKIVSSNSLPPPPPPPLPPQEILATTNTNRTIESVPIPTPDKSRMNLMEAIRQAGGRSKLRAAEKQPTSSDKIDSVKNTATTAPGGNLMADLHNKLSMRRKGISGAKEGVMDRVSAMIPPPPKPNTNQSSNTEPSDDDWD